MSPLLLGVLALATGLLLLSWARLGARLLARLPSGPLQLALLAAGVRLLVALLLRLPANALVQFDLDSYHLVARLLLHSRDVYTSGRYPYLPLQLYPLAAAEWLHLRAQLPFLPLVKLPLILADAGTTALVADAALRRGRGSVESARAGLLLALNPLSIAVTSLHGQFDAVPIFFAVAAWALLDRTADGGAEAARESDASRLANASNRRALAAGMLLGLGIAAKSWPALLLPALLPQACGRRQQGLMLLGAGVGPALSLGVYTWIVGAQLWRPLLPALTYRGYSGVWGFGLAAHKLARVWPALLPVVSNIDRFGGPADVALALTAAAIGWRLRDSAGRCLIVLLVALAAASGWGFHWLVWPLPFAALVAERPARLYTVLGTVQYALIYLLFGGVAWGFVHFTSSLTILRYTWLASVPLWVYLCAWALAALSRAVRQSGGVVADELRQTAQPDGAQGHGVEHAAAAQVLAIVAPHAGVAGEDDAIGQCARARADRVQRRDLGVIDDAQSRIAQPAAEINVFG